MQRFVLTATLLVLAACSPGPMTLEKLAGPSNIAAIDAAAACNMDRALLLSSGDMTSADRPRRLMAHFTTAAIYSDQGRQTEARRLIEEAAADPDLNPGAQPVTSFDDPAEALLQAIQDKREALTGKRAC
ncbi:MAG: hypothetical protein ACK5IB_11645 [Qingshengfaniella sp.]